MDKQIIVIPKATSEEHIKANMDVFDFKLDAEDTEILDNLPKERLVYPDFAEFD